MLIRGQVDHTPILPRHTALTFGRILLHLSAITTPRFPPVLSAASCHPTPRLRLTMDRWRAEGDRMVDVGGDGGAFGRSGKGTSVPGACLTHGEGILLSLSLISLFSWSCVVYEVSCILVKLCYLLGVSTMCRGHKEESVNDPR